MGTPIQQEFNEIKHNSKWRKMYVFSNVTAAAVVAIFIWTRYPELNVGNRFFGISLLAQVILCFSFYGISDGISDNPDADAHTRFVEITNGNVDLIEDALFSENLIVEDKSLSIKIYSLASLKHLFFSNSFSILSILMVLLPPILFVTSTHELRFMPLGLLVYIFMSAACYIFTMFAVFTFLQTPNIIAFGKVQPYTSIDNPKSTKSASELGLDAEIAIIDKTLKPVINTMSDENTNRLRNLYIGAVKARIEAKAISDDFKMPYSYFSEQLGLINEITQVFIPTTVKNFEKIFDNTLYKKELKEVLEGDIQDKITGSITVYEDKLLSIGTYLLNVRLSVFDTSDISVYVNQIHLVIYKIELLSGTTASSALVIAKSINDDLLPSIIKTWTTADNEAQRTEIKEQLQSVIDFLQKQLATINGGTSIAGSTVKDPLMLDVNKADGFLNNNLGNKISKNKHYIQILNNQWH